MCVCVCVCVCVCLSRVCLHASSARACKRVSRSQRMHTRILESAAQRSMCERQAERRGVWCHMWRSADTAYADDADGVGDAWDEGR